MSTGIAVRPTSGRLRQQIAAVAMLAACLLLSSDIGAQPGLTIRTEARRLQPGELIVVTLEAPPGVEEVSVHAFGRDAPAFRVDGGRWRALVGIDLDVKPGLYTLEALGHRPGIPPQAPLRSTRSLRVLPKRFATRHLTVDDAFVEPPPDVLARITTEAELTAQLWTHSAPKRLWQDPFVRPVPDQANSRFGTRSIFNGSPRAPHGGADFLSPAGRQVVAPGAGRVVLAQALYFTGNTVILDHGLGLFSTLAHLSTIDVAEAETVMAGQPVGRVGATGRVTGPHLHWAVRLGGARVDPLAVLALLGAGPR